MKLEGELNNSWITNVHSLAITFDIEMIKTIADNTILKKVEEMMRSVKCGNQEMPNTILGK